MAISRPFLLALLGAVLLGSTFVAVRNARDESAGDAAPAAQQVQSSQAPSEPRFANPADTLVAALSPDSLESASFDARLAVGSGSDAGTVRLSGAFEAPGDERMPNLLLTVKTRAPGVENLDVGFVTTGDRAWFTEGGTAYPVPADAWRQVVEAREQSTAAQPLPLPVDPERFLRDVKSEGSETIGGVETEHLSARIDVGSAIGYILDVAEETGQAPQGALPADVEQRIGESVERAELDVWVAKDDATLRRMTADLELSIPGQGPLDAELVIDFTKVGEPQRISAPANDARGLPSGRLGELASSFLAGAAVTTGADPTTVTGAASMSARAFRRALDQKRKVVLFFGQGAADDRATAEAVHALERSNKRVLVLEDHVDNVDAYGKLVEQLSVYQAPAIVVVGRSGNARLLEGYVDVGVLRQEVADAR